MCIRDRRQFDNSVKLLNQRIQENSQTRSRTSLSTVSQNLKSDCNRLSVISKVKFEQPKIGVEDDRLTRGNIVFSEQNLTNTLKEALKSPLPAGPPPKKPPRTFAHKCMPGNSRSLSDKTCSEKNKTGDCRETRLSLIHI